MSHDTLSQLRGELAAAAANLKKCEAAYRGFKAFRDNKPGLAFCAKQLLDAAAALRDQADQLLEIADDLHTTYAGMSQQLELSDFHVDGRG